MVSIRHNGGFFFLHKSKVVLVFSLHVSMAICIRDCRGGFHMWYIVWGIFLPQGWLDMM